MTSPTPLLDILDDAAIQRLKDGYDGEAVGKAAEGSFAAPFGPAGDFAAVITKQFYAPREGVPQMSARDRELAMIALLADVPDLNFQTHLYLALMEGLSPALVVNTAYLAVLYRGANLWPEVSRVMTETFTRLAAAADADADHRGTGAVLKSLRG